MNFDHAAFSSWMVTERNAQGLTQRQLTEATGIHNSSLSYIETKSSGVTVGNFCLICQALSYDPATKLKEFLK